MNRRTAGDVFIGRDRELSEMSRLVDDLSKGMSAVAFIAGEPGVGKTYLLAKILDHAHRKKMFSARGHCSEDEGAPPFWPWVQVIRPLIEEASRAELAYQLGEGAAIIADLFPEIHTKLKEVPSPPEKATPERARFRLFDSLAQFLKRSAEARQIVFVVEDLHWADEPSLRLLEFLSNQFGSNGILIAGSYRESDLSKNHPLTQLLGDLAGSRGYKHVHLEGWEHTETAHYLAEATDNKISEQMMCAIHEQTGGVPLFVAEIGRLISDDPSSFCESQSRSVSVPMTDGIRHVVARRLSTRSATCGEVLSWAAIIGRQFDLSVLSSLGCVESSELYSAMQEAETAHLIDEVPNHLNHYTFRHALIQQAILKDLSSTERTFRHNTVAIVLEKHFATQAPQRGAEIAQHLLLAGDHADQERLLFFLQHAAETALSAYAYEEAARYFTHALDVAGHDSVSLQSAHCWFGIGCSSLTTSDFEKHEKPLTRAFEMFEALGEHEMAIEAALALDHHSQVEWLKRRALDLATVDNPNRVRLLGQFALQLSFIGAEIEEIDCLLKEARDLVPQFTDPRLEAQVFRVQARFDYNQGRWDSAIDSVERAVNLANSIDDDHLKCEAYTRAADIYIETTRPNRAIEAGNRALSLAEKMGDRWLMIWALIALCRSMCEFGRFEEARKHSDRLLTIAPDFFRVHGQRVELELHSGDMTAAREFLSKFMAIVESNPYFLLGGVPQWQAASTLATWAFLSDDDEHLVAAQQYAHQVIDGDAVGPAARWLIVPALAKIAILGANPARAADHYEFIKAEYEGRFGYEHFLGMASAAAGLHDEALDHYSNAWAVCEAGRKALCLVETGYHYGSFLLRHQHTDRAEASEVISVALHEARRCGMKLWVRKLKMLEQSYPNGLSPREVEVLRVAAEGLTDKQIGERLFISAKTVGNHLTHIREKTSLHSRSALVRFAMEQNLLSSHQSSATPQ